MTLTQAVQPQPIESPPPSPAPELWDGITRQALAAWFRERGHTLSRLAALSGRYSKGALSDWFNGHYLGDNAAVGNELLRLKRHIEQTASEPAAAQDVFVETSIAKEVFTILKVARLDQDLALISSLPGRGKSTAAREYARRNPGVYYFEADDTCCVNTVARWLCGELHVTYNHGQLDLTLSRLVEACQGRDMQVIIDQAEFLIKKYKGTIRSIKGLELMRTLHDRAGVSIVLIALPQLYQDLLRRPQISGYILSRIGIRRDLPMPTDDDVALWAEAHGITDAGAVRELSARKGAAGHLRTVRMAARKALRLAQVNHRPVDATVVREAFQYVYV